MSTLNELRSLVLTSLGRDDADAVTVANSAINYAVTIAALTFNPPELYKISDILITGGTDRIYFPYVVMSDDISDESFIGLFEIDPNGDLMPIDGETLSTHLLDIIKVYNRTGSSKLSFIPYERWDMVIPTSLTSVRYWTLFGNVMILGATPSVNTTLRIGYTTYPAFLTEGNDNVEFEHFDSYIVSTAVSICFAAFEEEDATALWASIANLVGSPSALSTKAKAIIEGQKVIMENTLTQMRG